MQLLKTNLKWVPAELFGSGNVLKEMGVSGYGSRVELRYASR
jgi:hypothetical protein